MTRNIIATLRNGNQKRLSTRKQRNEIIKDIENDNKEIRSTSWSYEELGEQIEIIYFLEENSEHRFYCL